MVRVAIGIDVVRARPGRAAGGMARSWRAPSPHVKSVLRDIDCYRNARTPGAKGRDAAESR